MKPLTTTHMEGKEPFIEWHLHLKQSPYTRAIVELLRFRCFRQQ